MRKPTRSEVMRSLYGAAMGQEPWAEAMDRLADYTDSRFVSLDTYDVARSSSHVHACNVRPDHRVIVEYAKAIGPGHELIEAIFPYQSRGAIVKDTDVVPARKLKETQIYNNLFKPLRTKHVAGITLELGRTVITEYSFMKPHDAGEISERDLDVLRDLQDDLTQIWLGYRHLQSIEQSLETLQSLWDRFEHAALITDHQRKLKFANRAAEAMLRGRYGLILDGNRLTGATPAIERTIRSAYAKLALHEHEIVSLTPDAYAFPDELKATLFRIDDEQIALIITDPVRSSHDFVAGLQRCYQLTPSEARLVNDLLAGKSLRNAARNRGIRYETARTHVKNAMQKNGWRRQGEMIAAALRRLLPIGAFGG